MKLAALLLLTAAAGLAQAPAKPAAHAATPASSHGAPASHTACAKLPEISPKVPALPAGTPCAKHLYTLSTLPSIKLDYVSPLEGAGLRETLGIEPSTFSLDYIDTKIGTGPLAAPHKWYSIQYTGYLTDGTKFDSSLDHGGQPISIPYGQHGVIPGWDTGFDGMHIGGKRRLFIPYQLAYGTKGSPPVIPPKALLIFDVELVAQSDTEPRPPAPPAPPAAATKPAAPAAPAPSPAPAGATPATPPPTAPKP